MQPEHGGKLIVQQKDHTICLQLAKTILVQNALNYGVVRSNGAFNHVGATNTVCYPLGLVTTPQNTFWTGLVICLHASVTSFSHD